MALREQFSAIRQSFFDFVANCFLKVAEEFGFPENKGMPIEPRGEYYWNKDMAINKLPVREVRFPPETHPKTYLEILFGDAPRITPLERVFYESKEDGYFSFYIENYKNIFFLPNSISEFLQIKCNFCLDIQFLEICRETVFIMLVTYYYMVSFRILIAWLLTINPYTFPMAYFVALTDWIEDIAGGILPVINGVSMGTPLFLAVIGKLADCMNHLVFTMPYLPSEGNVEKIIIDGELKSILRFKYLPILWYKYPIPNDIREYWYNERPDILKYLQKSYENLDIQFLPDRIIGFNSEVESTSNVLLSDNLSHFHHFNDYYHLNFEGILSTIFHIN